MPLHGISMAYSFDRADLPTRKQTQHFEMAGDRAIWHRGWKAVARHTKGEDFDADRWELYRLDEDFAEIDDLADVHPEKLQALVALWWTEAERYGVLPLDDRDVERSLAWSRNEVPRHFELQPGMARFDRQLVPPINDRSWQLRAKLQVASPNAHGIVLACGSRFAGYQLHCAGAKAVFTYAVHESLVHRLEAPLPQGEAMVEVVFTRSGERAGEFALRVNGVPAAWARVGRDLERFWHERRHDLWLWQCTHHRRVLAPCSADWPTPAWRSGRRRGRLKRRRRRVCGRPA